MGTSWKNKLVGAVAAGAIVAGLFPVSAFGAGALTADKTITVNGLESGDTATYFQIVEIDGDKTEDSYSPASEYNAEETYYTESDGEYTEASVADADQFADGTYYTKSTTTTIGTQKWKLTSAVDANGDGKIDGSNYTVDNLQITNKATQGTERITVAIANAITSALNSNGATATGSMTMSGTTASKDVDPGLYMVVATPGENNKNIVYKPIFVSADYDQEATNTNSITLQNKATGYKDDESVFKKSPVTVDKESGTETDKQNDVAVGDIVDFTITVPLVTYTKNYTNPVFKITDELTEGLVLSKASGEAATADDITVTVKVGDTAVNCSRNTDYTVTLDETSPTKKFVVEFQNDSDPNTDADGDGTKTNDQDGFLYKVQNGAATVTITYKAKVTSEAALQVNQMDNTATLNFSNKPSDKTGAGELKDKTRHYTFDIDGNVFGKIDNIGPEGTKTSELRKVAIDADGNIIQEESTSEDIKDGSTPEGAKYDWLQGAEFELTKVKSHVETGAGTGTFNDCTPETIKFDDAGLRVTSGGGNAKSDANGYIPMKGLDAGVYKLKEVKAPLGYAFNPNIEYTITITPTYVAEPDGTTTDGSTGGGDLILEKYEVKIEAPELDNNQQPTNNTVTTISTYTAKSEKVGEEPNQTDAPISFLNDGGTKNDEAGFTFTQTGDPKDMGTALITNKKLGLLPATGGSGIYFYLAVGGAIAGVSLYLMKKDERAEAAE